MNEVYDAQFFYDKFTAIHEDLWIEGAVEKNGKCCAMGHCGSRPNAPTEEADKLYDLFIEKLGTAPPGVNDGRNKNFQQATPKQRILAALQTILDQKRVVKGRLSF